VSDLIDLLREIQDGLPIVSRPYAAVADEMGISEEKVLAMLRDARAQGVVRRICASVAHRRVGITCNAMCAWDVPDDSVARAGEVLAAHPSVTHAFERPRGADWPYNIYAMTHSHDREICRKVFEELSARIGPFPGVILYGAREFKKKSLRI